MPSPGEGVNDKGYDKLYHKDFRNLLHHKRQTTIQITFGNNISNKAKYIYGHLDNLTSNNLSFITCSKPKHRLYSSLESISRNTLLKYHGALSSSVEELFKNSLPSNIGLIIDGWKGANQIFYCGIYYQFPDENGMKIRPLMAICPLVYERDHGAASYFETISATLEWYGLTIDNMLYLISDNCSTMQALARDYLECPFIGCYSHKMNLTVKRYLLYPERSFLIDKVRLICVKLRTMLNTAHLRELIKKPDGQSFIRLRNTMISMRNRDTDVLMPNEVEHRDIVTLTNDSKKFL